VSLRYEPYDTRLCCPGRSSALLLRLSKRDPGVSGIVPVFRTLADPGPVTFTDPFTDRERN
jgi:hypothetical protein